jgi:hypothetical protein
MESLQSRNDKSITEYEMSNAINTAKKAAKKAATAPTTLAEAGVALASAAAALLPTVEIWTEEHTSIMGDAYTNAFKDLRTVKGMAKYRSKVIFSAAPEEIQEFLITFVTDDLESLGLDVNWSALVKAIGTAEVKSTRSGGASKGSSYVGQGLAMRTWLETARAGKLPARYGRFTASNPLTGGGESYHFTMTQYSDYCLDTEFQVEQSDGSTVGHKMGSKYEAIVKKSMQITLDRPTSERAAQKWVDAHGVMTVGSVHTPEQYSGGGWNAVDDKGTGNPAGIEIFVAGLKAEVDHRPSTEAEKLLAIGTFLTKNRPSKTIRSITLKPR